MKDLRKLFKSDNGIFIFSLILGLGFAGLFKMSCDSRSCLVYQAPDFEKKRQIKVNNKCYDVSEEMIDCSEAEDKEKILM
tara:strand:- start:706 stop:945 length:240 start_codon:yes stop_codon:yes gene_type:complete